MLAKGEAGIPPRQASGRREEILLVHTRKFSISTAELIGESFFAQAKNPAEQARRSLRRLVTDGFLASQKVLCHPVPDFDAPLVVWAPGDPEPDSYALQYATEQRWSTAPRQTTVFFATKKASRALGGCHLRSLNSLHASHDLLTAPVYLHVARTAPREAAHWVSEGIYSKTLREREKPGDARLIESQETYRLIEILGRYNEQHIAALHPYCESISLPYELW